MTASTGASSCRQRLDQGNCQRSELKNAAPPSALRREAQRPPLEEIDAAGERMAALAGACDR
jgi:hypothetical protein